MCHTTRSVNQDRLRMDVSSSRRTRAGTAIKVWGLKVAKRWPGFLPDLCQVGGGERDGWAEFGHYQTFPGGARICFRSLDEHGQSICLPLAHLGYRFEALPVDRSGPNAPGQLIWPYVVLWHHSGMSAICLTKSGHSMLSPIGGRSREPSLVSDHLAT